MGGAAYFGQSARNDESEPARPVIRVTCSSNATRCEIYSSYLGRAAAKRDAPAVSWRVNDTVCTFKRRAGDSGFLFYAYLTSFFSQFASLIDPLGGPAAQGISENCAAIFIARMCRISRDHDKGR